MSRGLSAANKTASSAEVVRPILLGKFEFDSATVFLNNADYSITFNGDVYVGAGSFVSITPAEEGVDLKNYSLSASLSGIESGFISEALNLGFKNKQATIYMGFVDTTYLAFIDDPFILFRGKMDAMNISLGEEGTITINIQNELANWDIPKISRYTPEDQKKRFPGDKGFDFVSQMVNKRIQWGVA